MYRLSSPLVGFYCLTGEPINIPLEKAMRSLKVSEQALEKQHERMRSVFNGERLDHIPVAADLRWWFAERYNNGTLEEDLKGCDLNKIIPCSLGGTSFTMPPKVESLPDVFTEEIWEGYPIKYVNGGFPGSVRKLKISTPVGCLTAEEAYASRSFGIQEYPLKTIEDLRVVKYIYEKRAEYSTTDLPIKAWCAPMTPIQILIVHLAGIENTSYLLADYQEEMEDFMCFLEEIHKPVIEYLAPKGNILFSVENYSSEVSGGYFDKYLGPQLLRRSKIVEKYGAAIGVHHDGKLNPLFGRLKEVGVKYVNGITATASELEGLREAAGNEMILADIIPQYIFMSEYSQEDFEKFIRQVAEIFKYDNRVIFGIGDMLPCTSDIRRFETMIDIISECTKKVI
jgi:hypothetical protein